MTIETSFSIFMTIMVIIIAVCLVIGCASAFRDLLNLHKGRTAIPDDGQIKSKRGYGKS